MDCRLKLVFKFACFVGVGILIGRHSWPTDPTLPRIWTEMCHFVGQQIYLEDTRKWQEDCVQSGRRLPLEQFSKVRFAESLNREFAELHVSHLSLVIPQQESKIWYNRAVDTGIRARRIEGEWYVFRVEPGSAAEEAGFRKGDLIQGVNRFEIRFAQELESTSGVYHVMRDHRLMDLAVQARELQMQAEPHVHMLSGQVAVLTIPNFLPQYFDAQKWRLIIAELRRSQKIIIDLRDNYGGNFVAMLRTLSPFFCEPTVVGEVKRKTGSKSQAQFADDLEMESQLDIFDTHTKVVLRTFAGYGCATQPVAVLINENTQSVAEIFAQAMKGRAHASVLGTPSAGGVVLSVWYPVAGLGPGFALSVPEAEYRDTQGVALEGVGVKPQRLLFYRKSEAARGMDNWITDAVEFSK